MRSFIKRVCLVMALVGGLLVPTLAPITVSAANLGDPLKGVCSVKGAGGTDVCQDNRGNKNKLMGMIKTIINILLLVAGIVSVIFIIIGGLRYTTSAGDSNAASGAKNTIIYACVGLILAAVSYGIVNFVLSRL